MAGDTDRQGSIGSGAPISSEPITRRTVLRGMGVGAAAIGTGSVLAACGGIKGSAGSSSGTIVIGLVTPLTGPLAGFASGDQFVVDQVRKTSAYSKGFKVGTTTYNVNVVVKDSQSDPNRASQVARELILQNNVDMMLTTSTPETTNPVATVCEAQHVPCVSTVVPWESWYLARQPDPANPKPFKYTTMFFFGLKEFGGTFVPMWNRIPNDRVVAGMFPNDADGNAFRAGWPAITKAAGYRLVDGGAYTDGTNDYSSMIALFKSNNCDIFINGPLPPDFNTMWKQAAQQGYKPKLATVAKVLLFPADTVALGDLVVNIATDSWWSPYVPYSSSLDGRTAKNLSDAYQSSSGKQWVQSLGSTYSLFEVAQKAFTAAGDPHNRDAVAAQLRSLSYTGICGPINFGNGPAPGVGIINPVGVQWKKGKQFPYEMVVVDNSLNPAVPIGGPLEPTNA